MEKEQVLLNPIPEKRIPDGVLGILFLIAAEVMYFAGLISAYIINRAGEQLEWPPYGQPRLPVEVTAINTLVLLASGFMGWTFMKNMEASVQAGKKANLRMLWMAIGLGTVFLIIQGNEWVRLVHFGLTSASSLYGAFFYVIIGSHGVHVLAGLLALIYLFRFIHKYGDSNSRMALAKAKASMLFWYFVVGVWPVLYYLVYIF